jgi:hypothetical protein
MESSHCFLDQMQPKWYTSKSYLGPAMCGGIFRDNNDDVVGCVNKNWNIYIYVFDAKFIRAMHAIEIAS